MNEMTDFYPDLAGVSPESAAEWHRVRDVLFAGKRISSDRYPECRSMRRNAASPLARAIDHTLLKQTAPASAYETLCLEAAQWITCSVCVPPNRVPLAAAALEGSGVIVCTVVGFPFGYETTGSKVRDAVLSIDAGASEIDMVIPVGLLKDDDIGGVYDDIAAVAAAVHEKGRVLKAILESSELDPIELVRAAATACFAAADFLKTSTGFANGGAAISAIAVMRRIAGNARGVKASGGIRTREFALDCLVAGADRIGASSTGAILGMTGDAAGGY